MLLVGLGGTGLSVARVFRARLRDRIQDPSAVRYLIVNDAPPTYSDNLFHDSEYVCTGLPGEAGVVDWAPNLGLDPTAQSDPRLTRPLGRLALLRNYRTEFEPRLRDALEQLVEGCPARAPLRVYIVSSCGSAGGGAILLDVAQAIRAATRERPAWIEAILLLPSVYSEGLADNFLRLEAMKSNAYATLMELDYFMTAGSDEYRLELPEAAPVEVAEAPLDRCHLLGMTNDSLQRLPTREDMFGMVAEKLLVDATAPLSEWEAVREDEGERWQDLPELRGKRRSFSSFGVTSLVCSHHTVGAYSALRLAAEVLRDHCLRTDFGDRDVRCSVQSFLRRCELDEPRLRNDCERVISNCLEGHRKSDFSEQDFEKAPARFAEVCLRLEAMEMGDHLAGAQADLEERYARWLEATTASIDEEIIATVRLQGLPIVLGWAQEMLARLADLGCRLEDKLDPLREAARRYLRRMQRCKDLGDDTNRNMFKLGRKERLMAIAREFVREIRSHYQTELEVAVHARAADLLARLRGVIEAWIARLNRLRELLQTTLGEIDQRLQDLVADLNDGQRGRAAEIDVHGLEHLELWYDIHHAEALDRFLNRLTGSADTILKWENLEPGELVQNALQPLAEEVLAGDRESQDILEILRETGVPPSGGVNASDAEGDAVDAWLSLALSACRPYWIYHRTALEGTPPPFEIATLTTARLQDSRLDCFLKARPGLRVLSSGDTKAARLLVESHGLPLFALGELQDWRLAYEQAVREKVRPLHLMRAWAHLPDLLPG